MATLHEVRDWLESTLPDQLERYDVPAATVAVSLSDDVIEVAGGVLNRATGVEATTDALFQIGSITKVWTATLVLQLVAEGRVDLDATVRTYLPDFRLADEDAAARITVRQMLSHTAGFEGDVFTDTGPGDDSLERYVALTSKIPQLFPPGRMFSYNNAGYCVLGRIVEVILGTTYDAALVEKLVKPLGLTHTATGPYDAIRYRAALGHVRPEPGATPEPAPIWAMARSNAPAGSMLAMRARDLVSFARMHLRAGHAEDGTEVLRPDLVQAMRARQVEVPDLGSAMGDAWGLGWELFDRGDGTLLVGHDGTTVGQSAFLRMVPDRDLVVVIMTNGGATHRLHRDVTGHVLNELADVELPPDAKPPVAPPAIDVRRLLGTYSIEVADLVVSQDDEGRVWLEVTPKGEAVDLGEKPERRELVGYAEDALIPIRPQDGVHVPHVFIGDDGADRAAYLHIGRVIPRSH